ncbi:MAG: pyridine nucleotide-disulfide oxidoreductase [Paenibacillus sp.]|nr:pyridine nucleotide-disulfide oxidoreductase [Paenibacillus sp.]
MPELASEYRVEALVAGEWAVLHRESGNRKRKRVHVVTPVATNRLRIAIEKTNGCPRAELIDIRVYDRETD